MMYKYSSLIQSLDIDIKHLDLDIRNRSLKSSEDLEDCDITIIGKGLALAIIRDLKRCREILSEPETESEIVNCKDCKNRGIVNICPFSGYVTVYRKTERGTTTSPLPFNYGSSEIQVYCNARDNDFCSKAIRKEATDDFSNKTT